MQTAAFTLNQPATFYLVAKQVSWTSIDYLWDGIPASKMAVYQDATTPKIRQLAGSVGTENANATLGSWVILSAVYNGAASVLAVNNTGDVVSDAGANNAGGFTLGNDGGPGFTQPANIQVKEVIIFSAAHTAAQRAVVQNYLAVRHQIAL